MSHWYRLDGSPCYEVPYKDPKKGMRATTLADARKLNLVPSVTEIIHLLGSPGLDNYKEQQILNAVEAIGYHKSDFWRQSVLTLAGEHSRNAREMGAKIHDALECYFKGESYPSEFSPWVDSVSEAIEGTFCIPPDEWVSEASFASELDFGGKVDLHSKEHNIVLDFKTKDTDDITKMKPYDSHHMQTAAYAVGLDISDARRYNLYISTRDPKIMNLTESTDFYKDWGMFKCLLDFWKLKNNF